MCVLLTTVGVHLTAPVAEPMGEFVQKFRHCVISHVSMFYHLESDHTLEAAITIALLHFRSVDATGKSRQKEVG